MPSNITVVGGAGADPGTGHNPITVTYTPTAGNTVVVLYQFGTDVTFTSVTSTPTNTWVNAPNSPFKETTATIYMGMAYCMSVASGSTTFKVNTSSASGIWNMIQVVELSNVGGLDQSPVGLLITNSGAIGSTNNGTSFSTNYPLELLIGYGATDNGEIALANGNTGCCLAGWTAFTGSGLIASGGPDAGVGAEYQLVSSKGTYAAQFADTVANDDMGIMGWSFYAAGQNWTYVQGNNTVVQTGASHSSIAVTLTNTPAQGDLLLVVVTPADTVSVTVGTIQDNNGNVYTPLSSIPWNTNYGQATLAYLIAPSNAGKTITCTVSTSSNAVNAIWVDEFNPNGQAFTIGTPQEANSTSPVSGPPYIITSPPSLTVSATELAYNVCVCDSGFGTSPTLNAPWTLGGNLPLSGANDFQLGAYVLNTTAGTLTQSNNDVAPSDLYAGILVAFPFGAATGVFAGLIGYIGH